MTRQSMFVYVTRSVRSQQKVVYNVSTVVCRNACR